MAGYAATARITQAHPRLAGSRAGRSAARARVGSSWAAGENRPTDPRPLDVRLLAWLAEAREEWAQATFFLFDPNSWR